MNRPFRPNPGCLLAYLLSGLAVWEAGCGGAEVKVAFDHRTPAVSTGSGKALVVADPATAGVFGIKLVSIHLAEDVAAGSGDNVGHVARIWTNPVCDKDLHQCGIAPQAGAHQVTDYFDLALPTREVNARLNSQGESVKPGSYRYLRMDMMGPNPTFEQSTPNLRFGAEPGKMHEVRSDNGYLVPLDPPLVVGDSDSDTVTVTLAYDLRGSYFDGEGLDAFHPPADTTLSQWYCGDNSVKPARGPCLRFTGFSPMVSAQASK
jgi:hypothetical protein